MILEVDFYIKMNYNRNKDNDSKITEMLEPIYSCLDELQQRESNGNIGNIRFTDKDIIAVSLTFCSILGNRFAYKLIDEGATAKIAESSSIHYGRLIREIVIGMSDVELPASSTKL